MRITRRTVLSGIASIPAAGLLPRIAWANATLQMGEMRLDTLSDGHLVLPRSFALGSAPEAEANQILDAFALPHDALRPDCNVTLLRDGTRTVLFDAGAGADFMPTAGKIMDALDALEVDVNDVTHIVLTHGHPDHLWGVLDDFDEPLFPNASYLMGRHEWDYWINPETKTTIDQGRVSFAVGAERRLKVIEDRIAFFDTGQEVLPGIMARATYGHTPGHMSFELRSGSDAAMVVGDAITNHHIAFARPDWPSGSDQDADTAATTRIALLDQLATSQMAFVGFHMPSPGIGRAEKDGGAYRYVPAAEG